MNSNGNNGNKLVDPPAPYRVNGNGREIDRPVKQYPSIVPDKLQPHNVEAEEAFIGSILINPDALIYTANLKIEADDFFIHRHGWIFDAINDLVNSNAPADMVSLVDELARRGQLEGIGGPAYLTGLLNCVPSHTRAKHYAEIVKRTSVLRQLIAGAGEISRLAYRDDVDAAEAVEQSTDILLKISKHNQRETHRSNQDLGNAFLDHLERVQKSPNGITGLPTGLVDWDRLTKGFQKGDLIILAGRPGMGKSALALQVCLEAAKNHKARSLFFSREMSAESLYQRGVSYESGIDSQCLRAGQVKDDEYPAMLEAINRLTALPVLIDCGVTTTEEMRARAIIEKEKNGLDLIVVDYLQRVHSSGKYQNRTTEIGEISGKLKDIAKDLNIPVLAISSLSRECERRNDKRPHLSDLRESGDIEYDADMVAFIYRDEVYNPDTEFPSVAEINVEKQRQGPNGTFSVYFKKRLTKFIDLEVNVQPLDWVK
jgi:replicative DNA helicase